MGATWEEDGMKMGATVEPGGNKFPKNSQNHVKNGKMTPERDSLDKGWI